ncbi:MAG: DUF6152 family protein [Steroidobacteraceae bacterium]
MRTVEPAGPRHSRRKVSDLQRIIRRFHGSFKHCSGLSAIHEEQRGNPLYQTEATVRRNGTRISWAALLGVALVTPCMAHHSFANFDMGKRLTLHGTVKELQWTNPHCFVQLLVPGAGGSVEWSLEMNSPLASFRAGWRPHTVRSGDKVTVVINPSKDGTPSGHLVSATDVDGHELGKPEHPPAAPHESLP